MNVHIIVLSTVPSEEEGVRLGRALIEQHLAACVNIGGPVRSIYRWRGKVHDEAERLLVIKTVRGRFDKVRQAIVDLHPYELPEVIALDIDAGDEAYLNWLSAQAVDAAAV